MSHDAKNWKLALYRLWWAEGYTWVDAVALGSFVVALGVGLSIFTATIAIFRGPPSEGELLTIEGVVEAFTRDGSAVDFHIVGRGRSFRYSGDDDAAVDAVAAAMSVGSRIQISILARDFSASERSTRVWAIAVDDTVARTFAQVSTAWYERTRSSVLNILPVILLITALASAPFFVTAYFEKRWQGEHQ